MKKVKLFAVFLSPLVVCAGDMGLGWASRAESSPSASVSSHSAGAGSPGIEQFGDDADQNGVPDRLDAYVQSIDKSPEMKAAVLDYYRIISRLSARALAGQHLTDVEKQSVFDGMGCFDYYDRLENFFNPDNEFMATPSGFKGMRALEAELSGGGYRLDSRSREGCDAAYKK